VRPVNKTDAAEQQTARGPLGGAAAHQPGLLGLDFATRVELRYSGRAAQPPSHPGIAQAHGRLRPWQAAARPWGPAEAAQPAAFHPQATLHATFGSLSSIMTASREQLSHCPGLGERKVARLLEAFDEPFIPRGAAAAPPAADSSTTGADVE